MTSIKDQACIVGVGQTPFSRGSTEEPDNLTIQLPAAEAALEDTGLSGPQIDAVCPYVSLGIVTGFGDFGDGSVAVLRR